MLEAEHYFDFLEGERKKWKFWKKLEKKFVGGIEIPSNVRNCKNCLKSETKTFENSEKKKCQRKAFKANLNELKRKTPNKK